MQPENDTLSTGISLQEYLQILRRRRSIILQAFLLITVVGVVVTLLTKPVYQATGELLVAAPGLNVNNMDANNPLSALAAISQPQSPETIVEVLQTSDLQSSVLQQIGRPVQFSFDIPKDTGVIRAQAESSDPRAAASAIDALFTTYQDREKATSIIGLSNELEAVTAKRIAYSKASRVASSQLRDFERQHNLAEFNQDRSEKMARVSSLRTETQNQTIGLAVLQAKIDSLRQAYAELPKTNLYTLPATNPRRSELEAAIRALQVQRESITQVGGLNPHGDSPILHSLDASIAAERKQLALQPALLDNKTSNPNNVRESVHSSLVDLVASLRPLKTQIAETKQELAKAKADAAQLPDLEQKLADLTQARDSAAGSLASYAKQESDLTLRQQARQPTTQIIQRAQALPTPIRPKKALNIIFSCVIGLFIGLCLALLQEFLDDRINTVEDSDRLLGLPSLGFVPSLIAGEARLLPQMQSTNGASESYRVLRTNINFASIDTPLRTLLVASSTPGEGKTTTAINLAFAMVMDGKKVILVDTDLRRPTIHTLLGLPSTPGLTDVLAGTAQLDDVLMQHSQVPGLMAITAGSSPPNPSEILNSRTFRSLLERLAEQADIVIMDSPPTLAAADAQILASQTDGVVLILEPGETKKVAAKQTLDLLRHARANVLGVAYNKMRSPTNGGYYYYGAGQAALPSSNGEKNGKAAKALPAAVESDHEPVA